ncbi:MAG: GTPase HflX [Clostridia bacterium]|nr:GTPase HflX [Clostridia bacterium]
MILDIFGNKNDSINEGTPCILVSVITDSMDEHEAELSLAELRRLADTAGAFTAAELIQRKHSPDKRTYLGSGKVEELKALCTNLCASLVVVDCELSPSQIRNLEDALGDVRVIDRSMLILDIFAYHAVTAEGKLQVELAQLKYTAPRLIGRGSEMSRLGGGIGTRGPGESQLETDRRHIQRRINALEAEIDELAVKRMTIRASREKTGIPQIAIVGYTNAGKSTLLNKLTDAGILAEDKLFATLDPTTRKFCIPDGREILLTDTVGFIRNLPHHLIKAFSSTLEEAVYADILLIIVDASDPEATSQLNITEKLLEELGAGDKPRIVAYNKCDREATEGLMAPNLKEDSDTRKTVFISAVTGQGTDSLNEAITKLLDSGKRNVTFLIPNSDAGVLNRLYASAAVGNVEYGPDYITVSAVCDKKTEGQLSKYIKN